MRWISAILCLWSISLFSQIPIGELKLVSELQTYKGRVFSGKAMLDQDGMQTLYFYKKGVLKKSEVWILDDQGKRSLKKSETIRHRYQSGFWYLQYTTWHSTGTLESKGFRKEEEEINLFKCETYSDKGILLTSVTYNLKGEKGPGVHFWCFPNGRKREEITIDQKGNTLIEKKWFANGKPQSERHVDAEGTGFYKSWYDNGQISQLRELTKNQNNGSVKSWYPSGQLRAHTDFVNGIYKDGTWGTWYEDGSKQSEVAWKNGKRHGLFQAWYRTGDIMTRQNYENGKPQGKHRQWYEKEVPMNIKQYDKGKLNGPFLEYWPNGQLRKRSVYDYGVVTDTTTHYNDDGRLVKENIYHNSDSVLVTRKYFSNGNLLSLRTEKLGKPDGVQQDYYENGQIQKEEHYKLYLKPAVFASKEGTWRVWDESGKLILTRKFEKNLLVKKIEHDKK